jgi:hypothetical protein
LIWFADERLCAQAGNEGDGLPMAVRPEEAWTEEIAARQIPAR